MIDYSAFKVLLDDPAMRPGLGFPSYASAFAEIIELSWCTERGLDPLAAHTPVSSAPRRNGSATTTALPREERDTRSGRDSHLSTWAKVAVTRM